MMSGFPNDSDKWAAPEEGPITKQGEYLTIYHNTYMVFMLVFMYGFFVWFYDCIFILIKIERYNNLIIYLF